MADDISLIVGVDYTELTGLVKTTDQTKRALGMVAKDFAKTGNQKLYMRSINQLVAAQKNLDKSARLSRSQIMRLGNQMQQDIKFTDQLAKATQRLNVAQQQTARGNNQLGVLFQQTGYQVGDFAVQVQGGTNVMVALGQQATQLVGTFGMLSKSTKMIGVFAALGVLIPVVTGVAAAFMRTKEAANEAAAGVKTVEDAMRNVSDAYEEAKKSAGSFHDILEDFNANKIADGYVLLGEKATQAFGASILDRALMSLRGFGPDSTEMRVVEDNLQKAFGQFGVGAGEVFGAGFLDQVQDAIQGKDIQGLQDIITGLDAFTNRTPLGDQFIVDLVKILDLMKGYTDEVTKAVDKMQEAYDKGKQLEGLKLELGVEAAASAAQLLAERLGLSLDAANRMVGLATGAGVSGPDGAVGQMRARFTNGLLTSSIVGQTSISAKDPKKSPSIKESPLEKLQKELDLQRELVGQSEAYVKVRQALGDDYAKTSPQIISGLQAQYAETQKLIEIEEQRQSIIDKVGSSMENSFMSMVDGTKSVKDAFKSMAADIIKELYRVLVVQQIVNSAKTAMGGFFADGAAFSGGRVTAFANGGVVGGPTYFPMSGGKTGLMGEAGPEAIMPLKRGANGKLGVSVEGGSGSVVVNNNINVTGGSDPAAIRMEVAKLMPQITSATKSAVIDARRRGGQMKAAFG